MKILAAIVTYNRSKLLERCVDAILGQTRPPEGLLVINNSSTDDTEEMLTRRGVDFITQPNLGGAGGFSRAIAECTARDYDAVWLMDDDGYPDSEALERLAGSLTGDMSCISSVVLREDDPSRFVFPFPALDSEGFPAIFAWPRKITTLDELRKRAPDGLYPHAHLFNGALVTAESIRKIGNVETGYFIFGDELDYLMRLFRIGRVVSHLGARHYHPDVANRPLSDAKIYYYIKNTIILNGLYFNRPRTRNVMTVAVALARTAARNGIATALSFAIGRQSGVVRKAVARGLRRQVGADFNV